MSTLIGYYVFLAALLLALRGLEQIREHYTPARVKAWRKRTALMVHARAHNNPVHGH